MMQIIDVDPHARPRSLLVAPGQRDSLLNLLQQEPGQREPRALTQAYALPPKDYFSQVSNPGDQNIRSQFLLTRTPPSLASKNLSLLRLSE